MNCTHNYLFYDSRKQAIVCAGCSKKRLVVKTFLCMTCRCRRTIAGQEPVGQDIFYLCETCKDITIARYAEKRDTIEWA